MNHCKCVLIIIAILVSTIAQAMEYGVSGGIRSTPQSLSAGAYVKEGKILWDAREGGSIWKYGYVNVGAEAAIHGFVQGEIEFRPISILGITYFASSTSRFYDTRTLHCEEVNCRGNLLRSGLKLQLLLGFGDYIVVPSYSNTNVRHSEMTKAVSDESEFVLLAPESDRVVARGIFLGKKIDGAIVGLLANSRKGQATGDEANFRYLVYKFPQKDEMTMAAGLGVFDSTHAASTGSAFFTVQWAYGEKLGL